MPFPDLASPGIASPDLASPDLAFATRCKLLRTRNERASVTVFAAAVLTVLAVLTAFVLRVGTATVDRARAQAAADAAALAGAADGRDAARDLAARNGATLVGYAEDDDDVVVTVSRGEATATATARHRGTEGLFVDLTETTGPGDESDATATIESGTETIIDGVIVLRPRVTATIATGR